MRIIGRHDQRDIERLLFHGLVFPDYALRSAGTLFRKRRPIRFFYRPVIEWFHDPAVALQGKRGRAPVIAWSCFRPPPHRPATGGRATLSAGPPRDAAQR